MYRYNFPFLQRMNVMRTISRRSLPRMYSSSSRDLRTRMIHMIHIVRYIHIKETPVCGFGWRYDKLSCEYYQYTFITPLQSSILKVRVCIAFQQRRRRVMNRSWCYDIPVVTRPPGRLLKDSRRWEGRPQPNLRCQPPHRRGRMGGGGGERRGGGAGSKQSSAVRCSAGPLSDGIL